MNGLRFKIILLLVLLAAGAGMILFFNHEPRADGHSLSYWLREGSRQATEEDWHHRSTHVHEAEKAIRKIGPAAIPVLLEKMQSTDPAWKRPAANWVGEKLRLSFTYHWAEEDWNEAVFGFLILGTQAVSAIPELSTILFQTNQAYYAVCALTQIGPESTPIIRAALTNADRNICRSALNVSVWSKEIGREVVPEMIAVLSRPEPLLAMSASSRLAEFMTLEEFISAMTNIAGANHFLGERLALQKLAATNINPDYAIPIVVPRLDSPDLTVRRVATNTLKRIDPAVAFAHGVNTNPPTFGGPGGRGRRRGGGN